MIPVNVVIFSLEIQLYFNFITLLLWCRPGEVVSLV